MEAQTFHSARLTRNDNLLRAGLITGGVIVAIIVSVFLVRHPGSSMDITSLLPDLSNTKATIVSRISTNLETLSGIVSAMFN